MRPELISCKDGDPQLLEYEMLSPYMLSNGEEDLERQKVMWGRSCVQTEGLQKGCRGISDSLIVL